MNIPLPAPVFGRKGQSIYGFDKMEIGDVLFFDVFDMKMEGLIRSSATTHGKRNNKKFACRKIDGKLGVWRTA